MSRKAHEEHGNHEAWAIPYGDLVTLLLAFFVVMYSLSSVNEGKYRILSDSLQAAFRGDTRSLEPIQIGEVRKGPEPRAVPTVIQLPLAEPPAIGQPGDGTGTGSGSGSGSGDGSGSGASSYFPPADLGETLEAISDQVERAIGETLPAEWVVIRRGRHWLEVEIRTDLLFASGAAELAAQAIPVIDKLGGILKEFPNPIHIEGYTDTIPINTAQFPSNWELSAARAATVVRRFATLGIDPARMTLVGLGEQRPVAPNDTFQGRDRNRRVVLVVLDPAAEDDVSGLARSAQPARDHAS
ncbi:MAG: flagellar motor protein MotB [Candidatus Macondimonas sp.]